MAIELFREDYFEWLVTFVCGEWSKEDNPHRKLLRYLYDTEFRYKLKRDVSRARDGCHLRDQYVAYFDIRDIPSSFYDYPCSVLEMMIALAIRCETIMDNPHYGDRTRQWFWRMISSLGLSSVTDYNYDEYYVREVVNTFLDRKYCPDGRGGLFTIKHCQQDLRKAEIWHQMCWYLDSIA